MLTSALRAEDKTVTEADAVAPISINKGDSLTFVLKDKNSGLWNYNALSGAFSDPTIPTNNQNALLLSYDAENSTSNVAGTLASHTFNAINSGQIVLLFSKVGTDPVYKFQKVLTFIINIKDPTTTTTPAAQ